MTRVLTIHDDAKRELRIARQQTFVNGGTERAALLNRTLRSAWHVIRTAPLRCALHDSEHRVMLLDRFAKRKSDRLPWRIIYRVTPYGARIVAVEHTADKMGTWSHRR